MAMSDAANQLARLITREIKKHDAKDRDGRMKMGIVTDVTPLTIQPLGGRLTLREDDLVWSNAARRVQATLEVGDSVMLSMTGGVYTVVDVAGKVNPVATTAAEVTQSGGMAGANVQVALNNADSRLDVLETLHGTIVGQVVDFPGPRNRIPARWLSCDGTPENISSEPKLFDALVGPIESYAAVNGSPTKTLVAHGFAVGDAIFDLGQNAMRYVDTVPTADTFTTSATRTINAATGVVTFGGSTTAAVTGPIQFRRAPHGMTTTTFNKPDYNGRVGVGRGNAFWTGGNVIGLSAGESTIGNHTYALTIPNHTHNIDDSVSRAAVGVINGNIGWIGAVASTPFAYTAVTAYSHPPGSVGGTYGFNHHTPVYGQTTLGGGGGAVAGTISGHNNMQPGIVVNKIIYAGAL
jgi:microcystin-dependent protein